MTRLQSLALFAVISVGLWQAALPTVVLIDRFLYPQPHDPLEGISVLFRYVLWLWTASLVFAAVALYELRRSFRVLYGLIEIVAAVALIYLTFKASSSIENLRLKRVPTESDYEMAFSSVLQIAAALYVFVRGLDNTSAGLRPGSRARMWWDRIFPGIG
jgi:hypothetical protein